MTSIAGLDYATMASGVVNLQFADVKRFTHVRSYLFCNGNSDIEFRWSSDGVNVDIVDTVTILAGVGESVSSPIKAKYLAITLDPAVPPSSYRTQHLFYDAPLSLSSLGNTGTGAELYKKSEHLIRTVKSSDASVTITEDPSEVDITVTLPPSVTVASGNVGLVVAGLTSYSLKCGLGGNSIPTNSVMIADRVSCPFTGDDNVVIGGRGTNAGNGIGTRTQNVIIGSYPGWSSFTGSGNTHVGYQNSTYSGANNVSYGSYSAGISTGPAQGSGWCAIGSVACSGTGSGSAKSQWIAIGSICCQGGNVNDYSISIGQSCTNSGASLVGSYSISLGASCAVDSTSGRLNFGSSMEAIQTTATAGVQTLPSNPAGFMRVKHNGTLYKIPLYND